MATKPTSTTSNPFLKKDERFPMMKHSPLQRRVACSSWSVQPNQVKTSTTCSPPSRKPSTEKFRGKKSTQKTRQSALRSAHSKQKCSSSGRRRNVADSIPYYSLIFSPLFWKQSSCFLLCWGRFSTSFLDADRWVLIERESKKIKFMKIWVRLIGKNVGIFWTWLH